jgi:hypothetical protein
MGVGCAPPFPLHSPVLHLFVHIVSDQTEVGEELSLGDVVRVDGVVRVVLWGRMYGSGFDGVVGNRRDRNRSGTRHYVLLSGSVEGGAQIESPLLDAGFGYVGLERLLVGLVLFTETFQ